MFGDHTLADVYFEGFNRVDLFPLLIEALLAGGFSAELPSDEHIVFTDGIESLIHLFRMTVPGQSAKSLRPVDIHNLAGSF